jgi:hypothetical protein
MGWWEERHNEVVMRASIEEAGIVGAVIGAWNRKSGLTSSCLLR